MREQLPDDGHPRWLRLPWATFTSFWPVLPIWRRLDSVVGWVSVYTALVVLAVNATELRLPEWSGGSAILNTLVLGLLLGFRNQQAYDRWWEGRKLWGQLINDSRCLCAKAASLSALSATARETIAQLVPAFAISLKRHLRGELEDPAEPESVTTNEKPVHRPLSLFERLTHLLQSERASGRLTELDILYLESHIRAFMDVCGGCERIKNTPVPLSYRALLRHGLVLYLLSTPWLVADHLVWWTIPVTALLAYFLLGIELTADDIENPFGREGDNLALSDYCETIMLSAKQLMK